jgi:hypothetical protein
LPPYNFLFIIYSLDKKISVITAKNSRGKVDRKKFQLPTALQTNHIHEFVEDFKE